MRPSDLKCAKLVTSWDGVLALANDSQGYPESAEKICADSKKNASQFTITQLKSEQHKVGVKTYLRTERHNIGLKNTTKISETQLKPSKHN